MIIAVNFPIEAIGKKKPEEEEEARRSLKSLHCMGRNELNKLTVLPMCGFIAQLVEHRTGIAEVMGSNSVEALIFFQASSFQLLKLENLLR